VDGAGDQLLARSAFAGDQDGALGAGDLSRQLQHLRHDRAGRDDLGELLTPLEARRQTDVLLRELSLLEGPAHDDVEFLHFAGLR
jgi:hypothetical protein